LVIGTQILSRDLDARTPKSANATMIGVPFEARERVRLGIIGVGGRGTSLLQDLLAIEKVEVKAICDLVPEKVARAQKAVTNAGKADRKSTRLNSSHVKISYAVFCLKKKSTYHESSCHRQVVKLRDGNDMA